MDTNLKARSRVALRDIIMRSYGQQSPSPGELDYLDRHLHRYAATMGLLPEAAGRLLDVGAFPGHMSVLAKAQGWSVVGISRLDGVFVGTDFAARMRENGIAILDVDMERDAIPVDSGAFDCVFFNEIVEHLPHNPFHALNQVWRVLRPGGRLVFSVPNLASFDHVWALLRGRSFYPEVSRPLEEAYHADIGQRHIREYTPGECEYLLTRQDKYLYRFCVDKVIMDRSWDGLFYSEHGYQRRLDRIRPGSLLRSLVTRVSRRYRSNIVIVAHRPENYLAVSDVVALDGFYPPECSGISPSFVRAPVAARWMKATATVSFQAPSAVASIRHVDVLMWMPAPISAGRLRVEADLNGVRCQPLEISPLVEPMRRSLKPSQPIRLDPEDRTVTIRLRSTQWSPRDFGVPDDDRSLGPMLCLDEIGVMASHPPAVRLTVVLV